MEVSMIRERRSSRLRQYLSNGNCERERQFSNRALRVYGYYLFHIFDYFKKDLRYDVDLHLYLNFILTIRNLINRSKKKEDVLNFLNQLILSAEETKKLTPKDTAEKVTKFYGNRIERKYKEDDDINDVIYGESNVDKLFIDLNRCAFCFPEDFFPKLLFEVFISPKENIDYTQELPVKVKRISKDTSLVKLLRESINLNCVEAQILTFLYNIKCFCRLFNLVYELTPLTVEKITLNILDIPRTEYNKAIRDGNKLCSMGFVEKRRENLYLTDDFINCIQEQSLEPFFSDLVTSCEKQKTFPLNSFNVEEDTKILMKELLKGNEPVSLLLYGKPGSGKTEFAKALAKATGLKPLIFKNEKENPSEGKIYEKLKCFLSMKKEDSLIIVDEADTILQTIDSSFFGIRSPSKNKGIVNKIFEENQNKIIWIVNFKNQIDVSTLRRFNFSCQFENMSSEQLRKITQKKLSPLKLESEKESQILDLLSKYNLTGASSENIIKTVKCLGTENENLVDLIHKVIKENAQLVSSKKTMRQTVSSSYDTRALNTSQNPDELVEMIKNAEKYAEKNPNATRKGIRMLFYGLSGTGKTEFARYISTCLGKDILLKRASDILDKYVGESEKHIKEAFKEAEATNSILLFDEADSFFADRNSATRSWERTQVNEFLTQMEEFSGILICTTNLKQIMDSAMNRRFHMIVEFKSLTQDGIECMLNRYFEDYDFTQSQIDSLYHYETVTPGDFGVVMDKIRFMAADKVSSELICQELCNIQEEKDNGEFGGKSSRTVGFAV